MPQVGRESTFPQQWGLFVPSFPHPWAHPDKLPRSSNYSLGCAVSCLSLEYVSRDDSDLMLGINKGESSAPASLFSSSRKNTLDVLCHSKLAYLALADPSITARWKVSDSHRQWPEMVWFQLTASPFAALGMSEWKPRQQGPFWKSCLLSGLPVYTDVFQSLVSIGTWGPGMGAFPVGGDP